MFTLDDDDKIIVDAPATSPKRIAPSAQEWDETHHFPKDVLREAAEMGMGAIYVSEDVGGSGMRRLDGVRIFEQLARGCPSVAAYLSIHNMCVWMIDEFGTDEQRRQWIPRLASMELFASYCLTEPGAGRTPRRCGPRRSGRATARTPSTCSPAPSSSSPVAASRTSTW